MKQCKETPLSLEADDNNKNCNSPPQPTVSHEALLADLGLVILSQPKLPHRIIMKIKGEGVACKPRCASLRRKPLLDLPANTVATFKKQKQNQNHSSLTAAASDTFMTGRPVLDQFLQAALFYLLNLMPRTSLSNWLPQGGLQHSDKIQIIKCRI